MMHQQPRFSEKLYYGLSLERMMPEDHLLRRIAAAVDLIANEPDR